MKNVNNPDKIARDLARIDEFERRSEQNFAHAQERMNKQFARMRERLLRKYNAANDSQQRIIEAALKVLKAEGLESLSLRKLARTLDMQAPALYWHFKNKEALIDHMAEAILQREFATVESRKPEESWQDWLLSHMQRLRKAMLAFPDGGRVVAGARWHPAITLARIGEAALESLISAGMPPKKARLVVGTTTHYTFGRVIEEQAAPSKEDLKDFDVDSVFAAFPHLRQVVADSKESGLQSDDDFTGGLKLIIKGAEAKS